MIVIVLDLDPQVGNIKDSLSGSNLETAWMVLYLDLYFFRVKNRFHAVNFLDCRVSC